MINRRTGAIVLAVLCAVAVGFTQTPKGGGAAIAPDALREWLTYLSSDELEGRNTFSEGLGLAAAYISERLKEAGVKPAGDHGSYFQRVAVLGVRSTNHSTLTVEVNGQTRTFRAGEGVVFPKDVGGKRTLTLNQLQFVGYGLSLGPAHNDYKGLNLKDSAVVWLGAQSPRSVNSHDANAQMFIRESVAIQEIGAAAAIAPIHETFNGFGGCGGQSGGGSGGRGGAPDFTTVQSLDSLRPPE